MIICSKSKTWQQHLATGINNPQQLLHMLDLDQTIPPTAQCAMQQFPLRVPLGFIARMKKGDPHDPLLRQILPLGIETDKIAGYSLDPLQELKFNPLPGLLHKYHSRVLLTITGACAINCRYCFRRHFPYQENSQKQTAWQDVLRYIEKDKSINEVIFSGGDPLIANDETLINLSHRIANIPHIKRLRIHTRMPIVLPERITTDLLNWLKQIPLQTILVVHCNHANEIDQHVQRVLQKIRQTNTCLLNQSVLLRGVNDNLPALMALSEKLFAAGVMPYYLHLLDKVQGAAHFAVEEQTAKNLRQQLMEKLPGYLVPKLVKEEAGMAHKVPL